MDTTEDVMHLQVGPNHVTIVDSDSVYRHKLWHLKLKPQIHKRARKVYATVYNGSASVGLHRIITGAKDGQIVDHINGNGLDNRASNLRIATPRQNKVNCGPRVDCGSGLKGVQWSRTSRKWMATITKEGVRYYLGLFEHKQRAGVAVDRAALALNGEFAGLNYPNRKTKARMPVKGFKLGTRSKKAMAETAQ